MADFFLRRRVIAAARPMVVSNRWDGSGTTVREAVPARFMTMWMPENTKTLWVGVMAWSHICERMIAPRSQMALNKALHSDLELRSKVRLRQGQDGSFGGWFSCSFSNE